MSNNHLPTIAIGSLGGTISMTQAHGQDGIIPTLSASELISSIPGVSQFATVQA